MCKGYKVIKKIVLFISFSLALYGDPYANLDTNIKINLLVNHFFNQELKSLMPKKPKKEILEDDGANLEPVKYELYFNYIQRLKAIHESRKEQQVKIDEKYEGQVAFYNGKLKNLKKFYNKSENKNPLLENSINKALKVVYGNPKLYGVDFNERKNEFYGFLVVEDIYNIGTFQKKKIVFSLPKEKIDKFLKRYDKIKPRVQFEYKNTLLKFKNLLFDFDSKEYKAFFVENVDGKIKLDIKINDDIFRLVKIEEKK